MLLYSTVPPIRAVIDAPLRINRGVAIIELIAQAGAGPGYGKHASSRDLYEDRVQGRWKRGGQRRGWMEVRFDA